MSNNIDVMSGNLLKNLSFLRDDFPIFKERINGNPLIFLDSAASAQKPRIVIDTMRDIMAHKYANIHRGLYQLSEQLSERYENVRRQVANFLGVTKKEEIIFTRSSTESINLVAYCYGSILRRGDTVLISELEHHANLIPWQLLRDRSGIEIRVVPIDSNGDIEMDSYEKLLNDHKVKLVSITHMSNVLGNITPARALTQVAHQYGAKILLDGSQAVVHQPVNVTELGSDFYVFSGHKLYGPNATGFLWGKSELLDQMPPFMGGGDMIESVSFEKSSWARPPHKFEAGTQAIVEIIGMGAALTYIDQIGMEVIESYLNTLTEYALNQMKRIDGLTIQGAPKKRGGVISFTMKGIHPHDIATLLDKYGIAIRAGHHCAEPLIRKLGLSATARISFGVYNSCEDIDQFIIALEQIKSIFV